MLTVALRNECSLSHYAMSAHCQSALRHRLRTEVSWVEGRLSGRWAVWGGGRRLSDVSPRSLAPLDSQWRIRIEFGVALVADALVAEL